MKRADTAHGVRKHHEYSPSSLQTLEACPAFKKLDTVTEASERGTAQHEATETGDLSKLTQDERAAVLHCFDVLAEAKSRLPGCTDLMEIKVCVDDLSTSEGFLDRALISADGKYAEVLDWKFGFGEVEHASNNLQGMAYAIGVWRRYPSVETFRVRFITPRQATKETEHTFTQAELNDAYQRIRSVVARAKEARSKRLLKSRLKYASPSTSTCRFCGLYKDCTAATGLLTNVGKHMPVAFIDPATMLTTEDPAELGRILDLLKYIDDFSKPVKNRISEMAKAGVTIDGYSLVSVAEREVVDEQSCTQVMSDTLASVGVAPEDTMQVIRQSYRFSLASAERALRDASPAGGKREAVESFREKLREAGAIMDGTPKVFLKRDTKLLAGAKQTVVDTSVTNAFSEGFL